MLRQVCVQFRRLIYDARVWQYFTSYRYSADTTQYFSWWLRIAQPTVIDIRNEDFCEFMMCVGAEFQPVTTYMAHRLQYVIAYNGLVIKGNQRDVQVMLQHMPNLVTVGFDTYISRFIELIHVLPNLQHLHINYITPALNTDGSDRHKSEYTALKTLSYIECIHITIIVTPYHNESLSVNNVQYTIDRLLRLTNVTITAVKQWGLSTLDVTQLRLHRIPTT